MNRVDRRESPGDARFAGEHLNNMIGSEIQKPRWIAIVNQSNLLRNCLTQIK